MERRSLRYTDGKSDKFWRIALEDNTHTVTYGRVGTRGQRQVKDFDSSEAAKKSFEKLVKAKLKRGYQEIAVIASNTESSEAKPTKMAVAKSESVERQPPTSKAPSSGEKPTKVAEVASAREKNSEATAIPNNWQQLAQEAIQIELKQGKKQLCELAAIDAIPNGYLSVLNVDTRKAIAAQPSTAIYLLDKLAVDEHDAVRAAVAGNAGASETCLKALAKDPVQEVRYALARNVYVPISALALLADEPYIKVIKAACENPNITEAVLERISEKLDKHQKHICGWRRREAKERRDNVKPKTGWDSWLSPGRDNTELRAALDPKTTPATLATLSKCDKPGLMYANSATVGWFNRNLVQEAVACNPNTPIDSLYELIKTNNLFVCIALARNTALPADIFAQLLKNERYLYPYNQSGCAMAWEDFEVGGGRMYKEHLDDLHWEMARNPSVPTAVLEKLAQHKTKYVSEKARKQSRDRALKAAEQAANDADKLKALLKHRDIGVRAAVTQHELGLSLFLKSCAKPASSLAHFLVLLHPNAEASMLSKAIKDSQWTSRYAAAQNPNTSREQLKQLEKDQHNFVQAAAKTASGIDFATSQQQILAHQTELLPQLQDGSEQATEEITDAIPKQLEATRSINLTPEDLQWVAWLPHQPKPLPEPSEFDLQVCKNRLSKVATSKWDWNKAELSLSMSEEEARFWLSEMLADDFDPQLEWTAQNQSLPAILKRTLYVASKPYSGRAAKSLHAAIAVPLHRLFGTETVINMLTEIALLSESDALAFSEIPLRSAGYNKHSISSAYDKTYKYYGDHGKQEVYKNFRRWNFGLTRLIVSGFKTTILPYLQNTELASLQKQVEPIFNQPLEQYLGETLLHLAAFLKIPNVVETEVSSWTKAYQNRYYYGVSWAQAEWPSLLFRLQSTDEVEHHIRRLNFLPRTPLEIRACIATTEFKAADLLCKRIAKAQKYEVTKLFEAWSTAAIAPEVAPYMLELTLSSKVSKAAIQWLEANVDNAIAGLIPVAAGQGPCAAVVKKADLVDAAQRFLLSQVRKGYEKAIRTALKDCSQSIVDSITTSVLEHPTLKTTLLNEQTTPPWLQQAIAQTPQTAFVTINASDLPQIVVGEHCLNLQQTQQVLQALKHSTLTSPLPLITALKARATTESIDDFVWSLFERWIAEGGNNKEKWAMHALGLMGSDAVAFKLTALIRKWPGENQHGKAKEGLECLRAIGSDTALMQINGIAQKVKYKALKARAKECMEAIARDRAFTPQQLEDRIIPDCGLDSSGQRIFDYGAREFRFALGPDLKPFVRDPKGKLRTTLPKPNQKDDAEKAKAAAAEWKLMKKQISSVAKLQATRLEQAMVTERRWPLDEFQSLLAVHPLMTHIVQRLVWSAYDSAGELVQTFRVAEDKTLATADDDPFVPEGIETVGLVHPLVINEDTRADWGELLSDYEIISPFPQLDRETYALTEAEKAEKDITRFKEIEIPAEKLVRTLEGKGWLRGRTDQGEISVQYKYFEKANVTAVVGEYENVFIGGGTSGNEVIDACCFLPGDYVPMEYPRDYTHVNFRSVPHRLLLDDVDAMVMSEVLRDLAIATASV